MRLFGSRTSSIIKVRKKDLPEGLWVKCPVCNEIVYKHEIEGGAGVCPKCAHHFPVRARERIALLVVPDSFEELDADLSSVDPLGFVEKAGYAEKVVENRKKTGLNDAVIGGLAKIGQHRVALGVMDFSFMGGSMGSVVGEKITRLIERGTADGLPVIVLSASGGARMQEGMFSLMQMAKTSAALARHAAAALPYISVMTHPTTAGVLASFASLGDVNIVESGAMVGFAGPRVIRETTREEIPPGFQKADFVLRHGLVDMIVPRPKLRATLEFLLDCMAPAPATKPDTAQGA